MFIYYCILTFDIKEKVLCALFFIGADQTAHTKQLPQNPVWEGGPKTVFVPQSKKRKLFCFVFLYNKRNFLKVIGGALEHTEAKKRRGRKRNKICLAPGKFASFRASEKHGKH